MKDKKGSMNIQNLVYGTIVAIIGMVIVLQIIAATASTVTTSVTGVGTNYSSTGLAASLFSGGNSVIMIVLIVVFFLAILGMAFGMLKSHK